MSRKPKIKLDDEYIPLEPEYACKECGKKITKARHEDSQLCSKCYQDYLNDYGLFED